MHSRTVTHICTFAHTYMTACRTRTQFVLTYNQQITSNQPLNYTTAELRNFDVTAFDVTASKQMTYVFV